MANAHRLNQWEEIAKARSQIAIQAHPWWKVLTWRTAFEFLALCVIWAVLMAIGKVFVR